MERHEWSGSGCDIIQLLRWTMLCKNVIAKFCVLSSVLADWLRTGCLSRWAAVRRKIQIWRNFFKGLCKTQQDKSLTCLYVLLLSRSGGGIAKSKEENEQGHISKCRRQSCDHPPRCCDWKGSLARGLNSTEGPYVDDFLHDGRLAPFMQCLWSHNVT